MNENFAAIILAAGKGKRMKSDLPKVLHKIHGRPLISLLLETITKIKFSRIIVVVGHKGQMVIDELKNYNVEFAWQMEQNGTGHAVMMTEKLMAGFDGTVLVANGDVPFLSEKSIRNIYEIHNRNNASATCLTAAFDNPTGYGRIIRKKGSDILEAIVEEKDADSEIKKIKEINSGTFCFNSRDLFWALHQVTDNNAQQEYYLTDTIKILGQNGKLCAVCRVDNPIEVEGVNSAEQLSRLEEIIPYKIN
jgi:UDP-N-acetylglucosamine diphosphorylase/glucosamine-1-phosphate N-acetyltransferase